MKKIGPQVADVIGETRKAVQAEKQAEKDKQRVMRHVARPAVYAPRFAAMGPKRRAYMKKFGSRSARKRRTVTPQ